MNSYKRPETRSSLPILFWIALVLPLLCTGGCTDPERLGVYEDNFVLEGPVALDKHVAYLNRTLEEVVIIEADGANLSVKHAPIGRDPIALRVSPDGRQLAVISRRDRTLTAVDVATGDVRAYDLPSKFDEIAFSPDTRFAITYFAPGGERPDGELINPNEYAVVDLAAEPTADGAVLSRSLRGFGNTPADVYFVPPFELSDDAQPERYAMFVFESYVTFADIRDPDFEVTVQLVLSTTSDPVRPNLVLFTDRSDAPGLQDSFVYLLAEGTNDVYAINLLPGQTEDGKVRLAPKIAVIPSGSQPTDMATFIGPDDREKLLVTNLGDASVTLFDAATEVSVTVPLDAPANRIHLYEAFSEVSGEIETFALLYNQGNFTDIVSFARLTALEDRLGQAVESLSVDNTISRLLPSPIDGQVVIQHRGTEGISLLDLTERAYSPLQGGRELSDLEVDLLGARLFAALSGSPNLNVIDLAGERAEAIPLDYPIQDLVWLPKAESVLAFHRSDAGLVTAMPVVIPEAEGTPGPIPTRQDARIYSGYLLDGLLEIEE